MKKTFGLLMLLFLVDGPAHAAAAASASKAPVVVKEAGGSTIVGEQDSAMGLTLMPWKEEFSSGLDQPPSLYRAPLTPVNGRDLQRDTEYRDNLGDYRRSHSQYTQ
jgi:hypothetical protein